VASFIALDFVCWVVLSAVQHARRDDNRAVESAYPEIPWLRDYYIVYDDEVQTQWRPYVHYVMRGMKSVFINIDDNGIRATWNPRPRASSVVRPIRIFMFGGSTTFGDNARDDYTIPSLLSKHLAAEMTTPVEVTNFGQEGYANTQEALLLGSQVRMGNIPDIAIFYDGANEVGTAFENHAAGGLYDEGTFSQLNLLRPEHRFKLSAYSVYSLLRYSEVGITATLFAEKLAPYWWRGFRTRLANYRRSQSSSATERLADSVASTYLFNISAVESLTKRYRIRGVFFWQPVLFEKERLSSFERSVEEEQERTFPGYESFFIQTYRRLRTLNSEEHVVDLSRVFTGLGESYYTDIAHTIEAGNEVVVKAMLPHVTELLQDKEWLAGRRNVNSNQPNR
jgi:hypothetical protein